MSLFNTTSEITITCHKRVAPYLTREVSELGYKITETFITGVRMQGSLNDCIRLNLNLRCASQILFKLDDFIARNGDDVYEHLKHTPWEDYIPKNTYFSVTSNVFNDSINNSMYANLRVKDAIVDRLRDIHGQRPETGAELRGVVVHLFWKNNDASLFLDTSGDSLGRHGYRKIPGRAPMLESLAAATILASTWDRTSSFVNPMCGSGTLAIEAALLAKNAAPGLFRSNYAFMHLKGFEQRMYDRARTELETQMKITGGIKIIASDYSKGAIENAERNAIAAGVYDMITFQVCDFADTEIPQDNKGVVFINPEYGERLGDLKELEETYARMGDFFKKQCKGYNGYIFTGNMDLAKKVGLKAKRRIEFYNSKIDCRLLEYDIYEGTKKIKEEA